MTYPPVPNIAPMGTTGIIVTVYNNDCNMNEFSMPLMIKLPSMKREPHFPEGNNGMKDKIVDDT